MVHVFEIRTQIVEELKALQDQSAATVLRNYVSKCFSLEYIWLDFPHTFRFARDIVDEVWSRGGHVDRLDCCIR